MQETAGRLSFPPTHRTPLFPIIENTSSKTHGSEGENSPNPGNPHRSGTQNQAVAHVVAPILRDAPPDSNVNPAKSSFCSSDDPERISFMSRFSDDIPKLKFARNPHLGRYFIPGGEHIPLYANVKKAGHPDHEKLRLCIYERAASLRIAQSIERMLWYIDHPEAAALDDFLDWNKPYWEAYKVSHADVRERTSPTTALLKEAANLSEEHITPLIIEKCEKLIENGLFKLLSYNPKLDVLLLFRQFHSKEYSTLFETCIAHADKLEKEIDQFKKTLHPNLLL